MLDQVELSPPASLSRWPFIFGVMLLIVVGCWIIYIIFVLRKRTITAVNKPSPPVNMPALKIKYIELLNVLEKEFNEKKISARLSHQKISQIVRFFTFEASGVPTHVMSLSDLKETKLTKLTNVIGALYPPEFEQAIYTDDTLSMIAAAKGVIEQW